MKNKIFKIGLNVLTYVFIALCLTLVIFTITSKKTDGAVNVFGYQARLVLSESMERCEETDVSGYDVKDIPLRSMVFIDLVPEDEEIAKEWYKNLAVGDVVTFRYKYDAQVTITHRIIEKIENKDSDGNPTGWYTFKLRGDNKALQNNPNASIAETGTQTIDTSLESANYIIGKVTGQSRILGVIIHALKQPICIALIIIVPSLIILTFEIIKIVGALTAEKRQKQKEEKAKQQKEIEELKKQLAELKQTVQVQSQDK